MRRCDDKRRLTDIYTSVRGATLLKASQRVDLKFRVNYRSHYYQTPSVPGAFAFVSVFVL